MDDTSPVGAAAQPEPDHAVRRADQPTAAPDVATELAEAFDRARLPFPLADRDSAASAASSSADALRDHIAPRLADRGAPLLVVVGGSTGAGKSTLVNSMLRDPASPSGVLRPTTRMPVLVHHPTDTKWFTGDRVLPGLTRVHAHTGGVADESTAHTSLRLVPSESAWEHVAILDAPDVDSVVDANRALARQLLDAADLWLFCTTAARYADAVPWELLRQAAQRGTSIAVVLGRVPNEAVAEVRDHLRAMMDDAGLGAARLFAIAESTTDAQGLLEPAEVGHVSGWLRELADDADERDRLAAATLRGSIEAVAASAVEVDGAVAAQRDAAERAAAEVREAAARGARSIDAALADGSMLRGEVLSRWHDFLGTSSWWRNIETSWGRFRDRVSAAVTGRPYHAESVREAVLTGASAVVCDACESAADMVRERWRSSPAGQYVLAAHPELDRVGRDPSADVATMIRAWQAGVVDMIRTEAAGKRNTARAVAVGFNVLGVALMIVVFAGTAFIPTGAEVATAAGTAAVGQRILEAIFGEEAVRRLAARARADLATRSEELIADQLAPFERALAHEAPATADGARITLAASAQTLREMAGINA